MVFYHYISKNSGAMFQEPILIQEKATISVFLKHELLLITDNMYLSVENVCKLSTLL